MIAAAVPPAMAGCTSKPAKHAAPPPTLAVTPAANAKNVPISAEISVTVSGGKITAVSLIDTKGAHVDGAMRADGSAWMPSKALKYKQAYSAEVTAASDSGKTSTRRTNFTTMGEPDMETTTNLYLDSGRTYGVAMPVTVGFDPPVPKKARANVQRRLFVTTDPPQPGAWHWVDDGGQVFYRAPDFWRPGTKISVRAALGGLPMGEGRYGDTDHRATAKIGNRVFLEINNKTKQMSVIRDGRLARTIPVSMGKPSTPTSSGKMVIMAKYEWTTFDTRGSADPYVVTVQDAQRLTWGGEFIHSAPWSVGDQGVRNVSHGCTNVSPANAAWLMSVTHVGDLVTIKGTEVKLRQGNGWTAWDMSWDEFVKGSALPVSPDLKPAPSATGPPTVGGSPSADSSPAPVPSNNGR